MGTDYISYCGPAIICKAKTVTHLKDKDRVCTNESLCAAHFDGIIKSKSPTGKYCAECGKPLYKILYEIEGFNDVWDVTKNLNEELSFSHGCHDKDTHIYLGNKNKPNEPREFKTNCKYEVSPLIVLSIDKIKEELDWFRNAYKDSICYLKDYYGQENVKVEFVYYTEIS